MIGAVAMDSLDRAIKILDKKLKEDGISRCLKIRAIPKPSSRKKFKEYLAERRRLRDQARKKRR
jgi:ribosomal protein S21